MDEREVPPLTEILETTARHPITHAFDLFWTFDEHMKAYLLPSEYELFHELIVKTIHKYDEH